MNGITWVIADLCGKLNWELGGVTSHLDNRSLWTIVNKKEINSLIDTDLFTSS